MENKINLFEIYNYHPYDSSKVYIDDLITTNEQNLIYEVFKKSFLCINKEIYYEFNIPFYWSEVIGNINI